ncbi:hypothetical protein LPJ62_001144, partial [Coemansia sp. RSA 2167]
DEFCEQYELLPRFAIALHNALFDNDKCPGAHLGLGGNRTTDSSIDPLVKRGAHIEAIVANLKKVLDKFKLEALAAL